MPVFHLEVPKTVMGELEVIAARARMTVEEYCRHLVWDHVVAARPAAPQPIEPLGADIGLLPIDLD